MNRFRRLIARVGFVCFVLALLLAGCATIQKPTRSARTGETGLLGSCAGFFALLDKQVEESEVIDPGVFRVPDYPYLRVDRFLASFSEEIDDRAAFSAWVDRMQRLDQEARQYEIANLPSSTVAALESSIDGAELNDKISKCGDLLKAADLKDGKFQERLEHSVQVPDEYQTLRRVLGIYPLTGLFISRGLFRWHAEVHKSFSLEPPVNWKTIRYFPYPKNAVSPAHQILTSTKPDALGIPLYSPEEREALFRMFAPIWEIQIKADHDRIGTPFWIGKGILDVNTDEPVTYTLLSFTRFGKEILTQLNYIIWFPSRPKKGALDIYGGLLDGINYRVTLGHDGQPLLYETMHNCGCFYKAYPTNLLQVRERMDYAEPPLILKAPDLDPSKQFVTLAVDSRRHFVQHVYPLSRESQSATEVYSLADYGQLRSLLYAKDERRSMFGQNSIVPGSERLERFILWPSGVLSPGAMRQWGRQAVTLLGKRHFDDPFFMDKMYLKSKEDVGGHN